MAEITNHTMTEQVHRILASKLEEARAKMAILRQQQHNIDLQVEDNQRIILSLERSVATLAAALPPAPGFSPAMQEADGPNYYQAETDLDEDASYDSSSDSTSDAA